MGQIDYWDSVAEEKNFTTPFQSEIFENYVSKDAIIVDIGCGYGRTLNELYELGYKNLIGMDYSGEMIKRGEHLYPYINFIKSDATQINMDDNSVDSVILLGVLTCTVSSNDQRNLILEINRILRPNGIVYINDFLVNDDERNVDRYNSFKDKYGVYGAFELPGGGVFRHQTQEWIDELLSIYEKKQYEVLTYITMNGHTSKGFYYIGCKKSCSD
ncbi:MAG: class I SAM-dependent methyltransferase [Clostridia bacterium]|nr:class I SAM-dependent methyltransferase [Clostridia bacterium]